jgi:hypothetical protein
MNLVLPRLRQIGVTRPSRRQWFFTLYAAGCASVATSSGYLGNATAPLRVPQAALVVLGLLMVFVVPGWSFVCAALPELQTWVERLLASMGISIIVATCAAVLLAATPMGFSRQSYAVLLGGVVVVLSVGGLYSSQLAGAVWELRAWAVGELRAWVEKLSTGKALAPKPRNRAKPQRDKETNVDRSVVVLRFSFDGKPVDGEG